jgi:hypothetical protein
MAEPVKSSLFQTLQYQAFRDGLTQQTKKAREWFRGKIRELGNINRDELLKDPALKPIDNVLVGKMFMYVYDPKHKKTLKYYDKFPLIFLTNITRKGYTGINLHYLPHVPRARLFDKLLETANSKKYNDSTKLAISYEILKSTSNYKEFKPCYHEYLHSHVRSNIVQILAPEWEIAMFLPVEHFEKATLKEVWKDSMKMIS